MSIVWWVNQISICLAGKFERFGNRALKALISCLGGLSKLDAMTWYFKPFSLQSSSLHLPPRCNGHSYRCDNGSPNFCLGMKAETQEEPAVRKPCTVIFTFHFKMYFFSHVKLSWVLDLWSMIMRFLFVHYVDRLYFLFFLEGG